MHAWRSRDGTSALLAPTTRFRRSDCRRGKTAFYKTNMPRRHAIELQAATARQAERGEPHVAESTGDASCPPRSLHAIHSLAWSSCSNKPQCSLACPGGPTAHPCGQESEGTASDAWTVCDVLWTVPVRVFRVLCGRWKFNSDGHHRQFTG
jgi:hypothetical protein